MNEIKESVPIDSSHFKVYIGYKEKGSALLAETSAGAEIFFKKYQIKETDYRVKTATLTTPAPLDLTTGVHTIKIVSDLHENFVGEIITDTYKENEDGTCSYQCQDMSREYQSKVDMIVNGANNYRVLQSLLTRGMLGINAKITANVRKSCKVLWSGLRPLDLYQADWGNPVKNSMNQKRKMIIRNKSYMEAIREICSRSDVDVYFDSKGTLQIKPISLKDWQSTGLHLSSDETSSKEFKFDTTNAITGAMISATDPTQVGTGYGSSLTGLNLSAFFGSLYSSADNPIQQTTSSSSGSNVTKATTTNKKTTKTTTTSNPYGKKAKKLWICADGGSGGFTKRIVKKLKKKGWKVKYTGEGANIHYKDFFNVTKDYQVLAVVDNGFDPACVKEVYEKGTVKNTLAKKGIVYCFIFDSRSWTDPKRHLKKYRYGNFKGMKIGKAHDDNYSNFKGKMNVDSYFRKHNVRYCCYPTVDGIVNQFLAGGYYKWKK